MPFLDIDQGHGPIQRLHVHMGIVEIACVKDYPGAWAEYRVYEGGYTQLAHRIATPAAMAWTEQTRAMFAGLYRDYALGRLKDRCFTQTF